MARAVTPKPGATVRARIVDDGSAETVYFGSGGQEVEIVHDSSQADIFVQVAADESGTKILSADEAERRLNEGDLFRDWISEAPPPPPPKPKKQRGAAFRYAIFGIIATFALGVVLLFSGQVGGLIFMALSPIVGPIAGWMLMGMLSLVGFR